MYIIRQKPQNSSYLCAQKLEKCLTFASCDNFPFLRAGLLVFDLCSFPSPQMTDRLVVLENVLHLVRQVGVDFRQTLGQILMNRTFGNAELFSDRTHRMFGFNDAATYFNGSFFDVIMHVPASLLEIVWYSI